MHTFTRIPKSTHNKLHSTCIAMVSSRDWPREGAWESQRTRTRTREPIGGRLEGANREDLATWAFRALSGLLPFCCDLKPALFRTRARRGPLPGAQCAVRGARCARRATLGPRPRSGRFETIAKHWVKHLNDPVMRLWSQMPTEVKGSLWTRASWRLPFRHMLSACLKTDQAGNTTSRTS